MLYFTDKVVLRLANQNRGQKKIKSHDNFQSTFEWFNARCVLDSD